jgi:Kef-type K+ transport system membrane component KefB
VGLFFFTVGFEIDLSLIFSKIGLVSSIVLGIMSGKAIIATLLCRAFGRKLSVAQQVGLMLSQGGEFAFVAFRLARSLNILDADTTKLMLTCVSLTMALTPFAEEVGSKMALRLEEKEKLKL